MLDIDKKINEGWDKGKEMMKLMGKEAQLER